MKIIYDKILEAFREGGDPSSILQEIGLVGPLVAVGDAVYCRSDNVFDRADATSIATCKVVGFVSEINGNEGTVILSGVLDGILNTLLPGSRYFLDRTSPGKISIAPPTAPGEVIVHVGDAWQSDKLIIGLSKVYTIRS